MRERFEYLDGLRGIAALIVVIHHGMIFFDFAIYSGVAAEATYQPWDLSYAKQTFLALPVAGNFSVATFFVLSGFVLSSVFSRSHATAPHLIVKRYVRLAVPVTAANLFSLAAGLIALAVPFLSNYVPLVGGATSNAFTLTNVLTATWLCLKEALFSAFITGIEPPTFNGVLWTMQIEFVGSCLMIGTFWLARRISRDSTHAVATLLMLVLLILEWYSQLSLFAAGGILFWVFGRSPLRSSKVFGAAGLALILVGIYLGTMPQANGRPALQNHLIMWLGAEPAVILAKSIIPWVPFQFLPVNIWHGFGAVVLLAGILLNRSSRGFLTHRWVIFLGYASFPLYLIHATLRPITAKPADELFLAIGMNPTVSMLLAVAVFTGISFAVATGFANIFEARALRWSSEVARVISSFSWNLSDAQKYLFTRRKPKRPIC
jgi:peptidoglycan/LPS O-acetylase OafA/YrhL